MVPLRAGFGTLWIRLPGGHRASTLTPLSITLCRRDHTTAAPDVKDYFSPAQSVSFLPRERSGSFPFIMSPKDPNDSFDLGTYCW